MGWLAEDIMSPNVLCVYPDMDLRDLMKLLLDREITGAPVTTRAGTLIGVVSQSDLLRYNVSRDDELVMESDFYGTARVEGRYLPRGFQIEDTNTATVTDVMTPIVHAVKPSTTVENVARVMRKNHIHRVIVEAKGKVLGIISALDLLAVLTSASKPPVRSARKK
jgi:CBS domain-containing protein